MLFDRVNEEPGILDRIRHGERIDHYETVRRRKDGSLFNISLTVPLIKDYQAKVIVASNYMRHITDRMSSKKLYENSAIGSITLRSKTIDQMKKFSYSVSHN